MGADTEKTIIHDTEVTSVEEKAETVDTSEKTEEKLFTQAEVDKIIKKRLERMKRSSEPKENGKLQERETELLKRENLLNCKEYLLNNKLPLELVDIIDTADTETFIKKVTLLERSSMIERREPIYNSESGHQATSKDPFKSVSHQKHIPKKW